MTPQEKAAELMHRYHKGIGVTTYDILMEMAEFMTEKACHWLKGACDYMDGDNILHLDFKCEGFRKAMEE